MLPASGPRRSHATAAACVAHGPLLSSGLDPCTPTHGSMRRAGSKILREALLGPQLNSGFCQSDYFFLRCASPPLQTCIGANGRGEHHFFDSIFQCDTYAKKAHEPASHTQT